MASDKVKVIEEKLLEDVPDVLDKVKDFLGDVFSLEVKLVNTNTGKVAASWKQYVDGDMEILFPLNEKPLPNEKAFEFFVELVKEASERRERIIKTLANIFGIANKLIL